MSSSEPTQSQKRPVFLDLTKIKFPVTAIVSIGHRLSGVVLFLLFPVLFYALYILRGPADSYLDLSDLMRHLHFRILLWAGLSAFYYHGLAGIRHLLADFSLGSHSFASAVRSAWLLLLLAAAGIGYLFVRIVLS